MKCGECLMNHVKMVDLVGGVCPDCGADYRNPKPTQKCDECGAVVEEWAVYGDRVLCLKCDAADADGADADPN